MNISMNRLLTLSLFKLKELFRNKTFLLSVILVPVFTLIMRYLYSNIADGAMPVEMYAMVLNFGVLFNINIIAMMMPATLLAKDKENNTLRTLMTSSVQGFEYFIGGMFPALLVSVVVNIAVLLISGFAISGSNLVLYLLACTIACFSSCVIGMTVGIFSKNQMSTGNIITPLMLVLMLLPMFSNMIASLEKISDFLYTGVVSSMIYSFAESSDYQLSIQSWCVLIITPIVLISVFIICYRKNGFDND